METTIKSKYIIDDVEGAIESIKMSLGNKNIQINEIEAFINTQENTIFFVDEKLNLKTEEDRTTYAWLDTGYTNEKGEAIFISLLKNYDVYEGHFVGTCKNLSNSVKGFFPGNTKSINENVPRFPIKYEKRISKRNIKHLEPADTEPEECGQNESTEELTDFGKILKKANIVISEEPEEKSTTKEVSIQKEMTPVTEEIYDQLLFPSWKSINGLDRYLKIIGRRLLQLVERNEDDYYVLNNIRSAIVNTGLMNKFGADFLVLYRINLTRNNYEAYKVMNGKKDWMDSGFTKEQTSRIIKPIYFLDDGVKLEADLEEFDINYHNLLHIIEERRERFPENMQEISAVTLATKLRNALERGLKMQQRDKTYAKAHYSSKSGEISWMMPFHINKEFTDEPELVMVINNTGEFYEVKTILPYDDDLKDKITSMSLYSKIW